MSSQTWNRKRIASAIVVVLTGAALVVLLVAVPAALDIGREPSIDLSLLLVWGLVVLLVALGLLVVVFSNLGLADSRYALGFPEGSVRAVIALLLILLFFIASIFFVFKSRTYAESTLTGVTRDEIAAVRARGDRVVGQTPDPGSDPPTWTVEVRYDSGLNADLAQQLLTTIGTLVVAVAAFYFGANSIGLAQAAGAHRGEDLADRVRVVLTGDAFKDVRVSMAGRTAVLTGAVAHEGVREEVRKAALSVAGVENVEDFLAVSEPPPEPA